MRGKTEFTYSNLLFVGGTVSVEELVMIAGNEMGCESPASKVIIEKSRGEGALMEQDAIENVS